MSKGHVAAANGVSRRPWNKGKRVGPKWGLEQRAVAAVFIARAGSAPQTLAAALALLYDVTLAEARVLELMLVGRALT